MSRRLILTAAGALVALLVNVAVASAAVTVTQVDSPDPLPVGGTVAYTATLTNSAAEPDVRVHAKLARPGTETPVDVAYLSFTTTKGTCAITGDGSAECTIGALAAGESVRLDATIKANQSLAQTLIAYKCTAPPACDFQTDLGQSVEATQVNFPPELTGSSKVKVKGLPPSCASSGFTVKAKAKKATKFYAYLKGPKSEFGTPLPVNGVHGRIAKSSRPKLKIAIPGDLDPGFYELKFAAKRKGAAQLKRKVKFQVCGPAFVAG